MKSPVIKGKIVRKIVRPSAKEYRPLIKFPTTIISDCLQRFSVMEAGVKPLILGTRIVGPAVTVEEIEGGNLMSHFALNVVQAGDILVIDQKKITSRAGWGGLQTYVAKKKNVAGIIVDGAVRDVAEIRKLKVPVFCSAVTPAGPHKGWGGNVNTIISCGGVSVSPGDIIVADDDGVVVVKRDLLTTVIKACQQREQLEKDWYKSIDEGKSTTDFMGFNKKLDEYNIEIE